MKRKPRVISIEQARMRMDQVARRSSFVCCLGDCMLCFLFLPARTFQPRQERSGWLANMRARTTQTLATATDSGPLPDLARMQAPRHDTYARMHRTATVQAADCARWPRGAAHPPWAARLYLPPRRFKLFVDLHPADLARSPAQPASQRLAYC